MPFQIAHLAIHNLVTVECLNNVGHMYSDTMKRLKVTYRCIPASNGHGTLT